MACQFRILDRNYVFQRDVRILPSSEDPNFPASNLKKFFRSKIWRSKGNFVIGATNCKLDFQEVALGPTLTATLPFGSYTIARLAEEIANQMTLAGTQTYTCEWSELTGHWSIETDGSYLSLLWASGTNTANSVGPSIGFNVIDGTGATQYTSAKIAIHTEERIVFDMGVNTPIDSFAMLFDPMTEPKFSDDAVLRLQASATNSWGSPPLDIALTVNTDWRLATHFFTSAQSYRYWAVKIVDPQNPNLSVELSKVLLAEATQLSQVPQAGFGNKIQDQSKVQSTPYGHNYFDLYPFKRDVNFSFEWLPDADNETLQKIYETIGETVPIGVALDPLEEVFEAERFFVYGTLKGDFSMKHKFTTHFDVPFVVTEQM